MTIKTELIKLNTLVKSINEKIDKGYLVLDNNNDILQGEKFTFENGELSLNYEGGEVIYLLPQNSDCTVYGYSFYLDEVKEAIRRLKMFKYIDVKHIKSFKRITK